MERTEFILEGRSCQVTVAGRREQASPEVLLIEPIDRRDLDFLPRELDFLEKNATKSFAFATFVVEDWNSELSPWKADPVFGKEAFGDGASATLRFIEDGLIPELAARIPAIRDKEIVLGGYSLASLFALWAGYESSRFGAIAAASPSVWFPGWMEYAKARKPKAERIYLSLGDSEERTRNRTMATVGSCIREMDTLLETTPHTLEWNPGNHFKDADIRTAKAFLWCLSGNMVKREIRRATQDDLESIMELLEAAKRIMRSCGNMNQWTDGYPSKEIILSDIAKGYGMVVTDDGVAKGYFAFICSPEPTYAAIYGGSWIDDSSPYHVIHRIGSSPDSKGIFKSIMDWAFSKDSNIRIDTHRDNVIMRHCLAKYGFLYCGVIYLASGDERLAYQQLLK